MSMKMSMKTKLLGMAAMSIALVLTVSAFGYWGTSRLDKAMDEITVNSIAQRNHMTGDIMIAALRADALNAIVAALNEDVGERREIFADLEEHAQTFSRALEENAGLDLGEEIKAGLSEARPALENYIRAARLITETAFQDPAVASSQLASFDQFYDRLADQMASLSTLIESSSLRSQQGGDKTVDIASNTIVAISAVAVIVLLLASLVLSRGIIRPLNALVENAQRISSGDLTSSISVSSRDEIGDLIIVMNDMRNRLRDIVSEVRTGAGSIADAAKEIADGVNDLSQRTEEQASSLEETASSMEEMTSTVKESADNMHQTNMLARTAMEEAEQGGAVVNQTVSAMSAISASSNKIADIIGVIDEIAFQTNLLALNAAVEAARAGEQGKGFAVVAAEVRNLAQRSATAAKEIKGLIEDGVSKVSMGTELVQRSGETLSRIIASINKVAGIAAEISAASQEQTIGIEQINKAVMQMDEMTQQNAALVEEASAASRSMEEQAQKLMDQIGYFTVSQDGSAPAGEARSADAGRRSGHGRADPVQDSFMDEPAQPRPESHGSALADGSEGEAPSAKQRAA